MAQLHAMEAPDRVKELEEWGALFDRTADGRILQRNFGGHTYPRLAHVGDRTGLEMIRTLQQHGIHTGMHVYMECTVPASSATWRPCERLLLATGARPDASCVFKAKAIVLATGGHQGGRSRSTRTRGVARGTGRRWRTWQGRSSWTWSSCSFTRRGWSGRRACAGTLITEGVRGEGGTLRNQEGKRIMFGYIPELYAERHRAYRRRSGPVAARSTSRGRRRRRAGRRTSCRATSWRARFRPRGEGGARGPPACSSTSRHGGRRTSEEAAGDVPSVQGAGRRRHHEGADGGRPERRTTRWAGSEWTRSQRSRVKGLFAAGECAAGMHGSNRLGGQLALRFARLRADRGAARRQVRKATGAKEPDPTDDRGGVARGAGAVRPRRRVRAERGSVHTGEDEPVRDPRRSDEPDAALGRRL